jgi:hypothetical protein
MKAIERGEIQREIEESAYRFQRNLETRDTIIVGVNQFVDGNETPRTDLLRVDPDLERDQVGRVQALRARRDAAAWSSAMRALETGARSGANVMPLIIEAVLAWATVGEVANCLRDVFGEHRDAGCVSEPRTIEPERALRLLFFAMRPEEAIALLFLLPTTWLTAAAHYFAPESGAIGPRFAGGVVRIIVAAACAAILVAAARRKPTPGTPSTRSGRCFRSCSAS